MNNELNPYGSAPIANAVTQVEQNRAMQEVQAAVVMAKKFQRDEAVATDKILKSCTRPNLAEQALYAYPRGNQIVTGPSIRLAEAIAQHWGNIQYGIRELEQVDGSSTMEAYAWDLETNTRQSKIFHAQHVRRAQGNNHQLDDPRDIYEMTANLGARRMRACILGIIPGDVIDAAVKQCEITQTQQEGATEEQIAKMVTAFAEHGVSKEMLAQRLGHSIDTAVSAELVQLRRVFGSIKDGIGKVSDFFEVEPDVSVQTNTSEKVMGKLNGKNKDVQSKKQTPQS